MNRLIAVVLLLLTSLAHAQRDQSASLRTMQWVRLANNQQRVLYYSSDHIARWSGSDGKPFASTNLRTDVIGPIGESLLIGVDQVLIPCASETPRSFTVVTSNDFKGNWAPTGDISDEKSANQPYEVPIPEGSAMVGIAHRLCQLAIR